MSIELELRAPSEAVITDTACLSLDNADRSECANNEPQDEIVLSARRKLTLQCGQSSITLYANGKIVLRGEYILSAAEGTNRLAGGKIELN